jgi:hypothetical protein
MKAYTNWLITCETALKTVLSACDKVTKQSNRMLKYNTINY